MKNVSIYIITNKGEIAINNVAYFSNTQKWFSVQFTEEEKFNMSYKACKVSNEIFEERLREMFNGYDFRTTGTTTTVYMNVGEVIERTSVLLD